MLSRRVELHKLSGFGLLFVSIVHTLAKFEFLKKLVIKYNFESSKSECCALFSIHIYIKPNTNHFLEYFIPY